ncbi:DNA methyltransferase [Streptococcus sp.]|uniref:DNA methyltransferase n=1 Tax=Streptococcus sp. TaxID=1306 RepID=UPI0035A0A0A6
MKQELEQLLAQNDTFMVEGVLNKNKLAELARQYNPELLNLLMSNDNISKHFFSTLDTGALVFKKDVFLQFLNNKEFLPDSFTAYKTKIGLATGDKYLSENQEVVLNFPYKDCVLEGGQTKEDAKRQEIFFNETLAPTEINRLLDDKVLTNFKRYDETGEHEVEELNDTDNLIIKGNNLIALHSLKKRFAGKVKLIYIDPPYYFEKIKPEDTFQYNSNFKLSTWLVFMKNRLEVARELLSDDGALFVQISDDGVGELHVLLKDVFNKGEKNNFINKITLKTKSPSGFASVNPGVFETAEYILSFAKDKSKWKYNPQFVRSDYDPNYNQYVVNKTDNFTDWKIENIGEYVAKQQGYETKRLAVKELGQTFFENLVADFALENADSVFRYTTINNNASSILVELRDKSRKTPQTIFFQSRDENYDVYVKNGQEISFYSKKIREIDGNRVPSIQLSNIWTDTPYEGIAKEGGVTLKGGKKPEKLIRRIIELATNNGDLVLDYHLGSGTTAAVAHKLKRQYIGLEQLNYGENDSVARLSRVIGGDQTGISKAVNWSGGGSFVYAELKNDAQDFKNAIFEATTTEELLELFELAKKSSFLSYRIDPKKLKKNEFCQLSLAEQKQILSEIIDNNNLYVNYSDIDDSDYQISAEDKKLNYAFYGKEK